jgi:AraC-like DNA-binding protein
MPSRSHPLLKTGGAVQSAKNYRNPQVSRRLHLPAAVRLRHAPDILRRAATRHSGLEEVATQFGLSRDHLLRLFRQAGFPPPMLQVRRLSLEMVVERLRTTEATLEALAQEFGYADASSLRRALRRTFGRSARELRSPKA